MVRFFEAIATMFFFHFVMIPTIKNAKKITPFFKALLHHQLQEVKSFFTDAKSFIIIMAKHPFYNRVGITLNYLFLTLCCLYTTLLVTLKVLEGHSILKLLICSSIFILASINFFQKSNKLYQ